MSKKIKTLKAWEKSGLDRDKFLNPLDEIDEDMYWDIACGPLPIVTQHGNIIQGGDACNTTESGVYTYDTVVIIDGKYYYLGELPEFKTEQDES